MNRLIYGHDRTLSAVTLTLGTLIWVVALYVLVNLGGAMVLTGALTSAIVAAVFSFLVYL